MFKASLVVVVAGALLGAALLLRGQGAQAATGPCGTTHDGLSAEESTFITLIQQWRDQNLGSYSVPLTASGPLNRAAAWFAQYQVDNKKYGGHGDNYGRNWVDRARDCGYDTYWAGGSGEGVYTVQSSQPLSIGPSQAIAGPPGQGVTYPGSGVGIVANLSWPAKCVGAAVYRNTAGTIVSWVVVIAQFPANSPCPEAGGTSEPTPTPTIATPTPTITPSPSPTASPTLSPTPTATPTPTPAQRQRALAPNVSSGASD
ncbi:MAG: CAP domain-containing protein [Tepidiformaceae bacterium]